MFQEAQLIAAPWPSKRRLEISVAGVTFEIDSGTFAGANLILK